MKDERNWRSMSESDFDALDLDGKRQILLDMLDEIPDEDMPEIYDQIVQIVEECGTETT